MVGQSAELNGVKGRTRRLPGRRFIRATGSIFETA
jgi:hypothetical protein